MEEGMQYAPYAWLQEAPASAAVLADVRGETLDG